MGQLDMPQVRGSFFWGRPARGASTKFSVPPVRRYSPRWVVTGGERPVFGPVFPMVATKRRGRGRQSTLVAAPSLTQHSGESISRS